MSATDKRKLRHTRLRKKLTGTPARPRLAVHFSGRHITAQVIDDSIGKTLVSVHTTEAEIRAKANSRANVAIATEVGKLIAERGRHGFFHYNAIVTWQVDEQGVVNHIYDEKDNTESVDDISIDTGWD